MTQRAEIERLVAETIHNAMVHAVSNFKGEPMPWQDGSSTAESYARMEARRLLQSDALSGLIKREEEPLLRRALEAGLEYAIDAANSCKVKDRCFDQIMNDVRRIEQSIAALNPKTEGE